MQNTKSIRYHDKDFCPRSYGRDDCWCWIFRYRKGFHELAFLLQKYPLISQKGKNLNA